MNIHPVQEDQNSTSEPDKLLLVQVKKRYLMMAQRHLLYRLPRVLWHKWGLNL
jgi:hypothetical protein